MTVTVIIPTYRRLDYLSQALASVIAQSYDDWHCLIINDYPPDAIAIEELLQEFNDPRLTLINHSSSQGGNVARNTGIKQAQGEIIAFLDDDDLWLPNKLEKHLEQHQQNPEVGLIFSGVIQRWEQAKFPEKTTLAALPQGNIVEVMGRGKFCPHSSSCVTVRRECFDTCGVFDDSLSSFQDWDMWFRIGRSYGFDCVSEALIIFRQHFGNRTSQSLQSRLQGLTQIITKWDAHLPNPQQFRNTFTKEVYITHIYKLILQGNRQEAFSYWQKLLKLSNQKKDILQLGKLTFLFLFGLNLYEPILTGLRFLKLNSKLE